MQKGFTLVEITVVALIIAILVAIAIPNLLRAKIDANEALAIKTVRTLVSVMEMYRMTIANDSYYGANLSVLGNTKPPYIDKQLGCNNQTCTKQGYNFGLRTQPSYPVGNNPYNYLILAEPATPNQTGRRSFCAVQDGLTRWGNSSFSSGYGTCVTNGIIIN